MGVSRVEVCIGGRRTQTKFQSLPWISLLLECLLTAQSQVPRNFWEGVWESTSGQALLDDPSEGTSLENSIISFVSLIPLARENLVFHIVRRGKLRLREVQLPEVTGLVCGKAGILLNSLVQLSLGLSSNLTLHESPTPYPSFHFL